MKQFFFLFCASIFLTVTTTTAAQTFQSPGFTLETGITPPSPTPTPFQPKITAGHPGSKSEQPVRLTISTGNIDYGPMTPTNPIKRKINISVDAPFPYVLLLSQNHALATGENEIPDTTCDTGTCNQNISAIWNNPFTFGFGYSINDMDYQQFADSAKNESARPVNLGDIFVKVNISPNQYLKENEFYQNTLEFVLLPKL